MVDNVGAQTFATLAVTGVYRGAKVFVNDTLAGHRPYGYSIFSVRIDEFLRYDAENVILVEATARDDSRWYSGAGIYRDTHLLVGEEVGIALDGVRVVTPEIDEESAVVEVTVTVENHGPTPASTEVTAQITDADGSCVARGESPVTVLSGQQTTARLRLYVSQPKRWSVETPALYVCRTALAVDGTELDQETTTFGIRELRLDAVHGLRINGQTVKLRGACVHHANGVIGAATIERAEQRRVELLKAAGFNALRSAHQPMSRAMLEACDRLGMLVMDEAFDMWTKSKSHDDYARSFPDWWRADVAAMVGKDVNHPSVIMYSTGNEIPEVGSPTGAVLGREIAKAIRAVDNTRFITNAVQPVLACADDVFASFAEEREKQAVGGDVNERLATYFDIMPRLVQADAIGDRLAETFAIADVAGYNYLDSRYDIDHQRHPDRVIVGTETYPTEIDRTWGPVRTSAHIIGDFTWTGWDYLGEVGLGRVQYASSDDEPSFGAFYPWLLASTGDLDITGHRRPISYYREIVYGLRSEPYVAVQRPEYFGRTPIHSNPWSHDAVSSWTWPGFENRPIKVEVYADADEVALLNNGVEVGRAPAGEKHRYRAEFETVYEPGDLVAVAYRKGTVCGRTSLTTAQGPVALDIRADRSEIRADDTDLAFVDITLVDATGTTYTCMDRAVTVTIDGPAVLQGLGSANPCTYETFHSPTHETYDGRALAVLRPQGAGTITITVAAPECPTKTVVIEAAGVNERDQRQPGGLGT